MRSPPGRMTVSLACATAIAASVLAVACGSGPPNTPPPEVPDGNPARGLELIERFGCGSCHTIPGVRGADGTVGPPLIHWSERGVIAGQLANNADNLERWIVDPPGVEPGTAMPNLGVTPEQARDIAAYLFTIE